MAKIGKNRAILKQVLGTGACLGNRSIFLKHQPMTIFQTGRPKQEAEDTSALAFVVDEKLATLD